MFLAVQFVMVPGFAQVPLTYGDHSVELTADSITANTVEALLKITVTQPIIIKSVSIYLRYTGSDGSQCIKFGIYRDGPFGSLNPKDQPLVAATQNGYCLQASTAWGPAWQNWTLAPSDYLTIKTPGTYWLSLLAKYSYGTIYHYSTTRVCDPYYLNAPCNSYYDWTYGYYNYAFYSPYSQGFPGNFISTAMTEQSQSNAPYSLYVTGTQT
jgi:hypothetical protein